MDLALPQIQEISSGLVAAWVIMLAWGSIVFDLRGERFIRWAAWTVGWQLMTRPGWWLMDIAYCLLLFFMAETVYHFLILMGEDDVTQNF